MKIYHSLKEFYEVTQPINEPDLYTLPLQPDTPNMWYFAYRYTELLRFCEKNPMFHLISVLQCSYIKVNRGLPNAMFYGLADGDMNPDIIYVRKMTQKECLSLRILEFNIDKRLSKVANIHIDIPPNSGGIS